MTSGLPELRFFRAAAVSLGAGLAAQALEITARLGGTPEPTWLPDALHLAVVGPIGFVVLGLFVRADAGLAADPHFRKGAAPRAYYTFALGLALRALVAPWAEGSTFLAALTIAGQLLEIAALVMMALGRSTAPAASGGLGRN